MLIFHFFLFIRMVVQSFAVALLQVLMSFTVFPHFTSLKISAYIRRIFYILQTDFSDSFQAGMV